MSDIHEAMKQIQSLVDRCVDRDIASFKSQLRGRRTLAQRWKVPTDRIDHLLEFLAAQSNPSDAPKSTEHPSPD